MSASTVSTYSCVNCGGNVYFDIASKSFKCVSCNTRFTLEDMNAAFPDETDSNWDKPSEPASRKDIITKHIVNAIEREAVVRFHCCPSCGAELMTGDASLAAAFCAFCGKPVNITERLLSGENLPSRIIPFVKTQDEAFAVFIGKAKNKPLLPKAFTHDIRPSDFTSVYVPFMLCDADCSADILAKCENTTTWSDSEYNYTKVDTYEARRSGAMAFAQVPADVSDKIPDDIMRAVEPFDIPALIPFSNKYLSGHYAEAPTTGEAQLMDTLYGRLKPAAENAMLGTIWGYSSVSLLDSRFDLDSATSEYVMLPCWMFVRKYKGKEHVFAVNGQTGKFAGKLPVDGSLAFSMFVKLALIVFAVVFIGLEVFLWIS